MRALSKANTITVSKIVAAQAMEMYKKGSEWRRNERKYLSCIDMGKIANQILSSVNKDEKYIFPWDKKTKKKNEVVSKAKG